MAYEPTVWKSGDVVTSAKLNKLEQGVASGGGVLTVHEGEGKVLDKTWQEIYDAGFSVLELSVGGRTYGVLAQIVESDEDYVVVYVTLGQTLRPQIYVANSADGYPVYTPSN